MPPVAEKPPITTKRTVSGGVATRNANKPSIFHPKPSTHRISLADIESIATITAKGVTESGACAKIGINFQSWRQFKLRHKVTYEYAFNAIKEGQLLAHLETIEAATVKDWRAADRLLAIKAPERFGKEHTGQQVATNDALGVLLLGALSKVYGSTPQTTVDTTPQPLATIGDNAPQALIVDIVATTSSEKTPPA